MDLSIIIPVSNEADSLLELHGSLHRALAERPIPGEVVFVDDGSSDGSLQALEALAAEDPRQTRAIVPRRNFGQTTAIAAGLDHAHGEVVVLMDADMQNDPADIPLGFRSILMGLIAELLVRTYHESQARPTYTVRGVIDHSEQGS